MSGGSHVADDGRAIKDPMHRDRRRFAYVLPLIVFSVIAVAFAIGLTMDPRELPSGHCQRKIACAAGGLILVHRLRRMVQAGAKRRAALRGGWVNHLSASVH